MAAQIGFVLRGCGSTASGALCAALWRILPHVPLNLTKGSESSLELDKSSSTRYAVELHQEMAGRKTIMAVNTDSATTATEYALTERVGLRAD